MNDPYGVPTGVVPRVSEFAKDNNTRAALAELDRLRREDPIQQAVDDYLLMERKARAWDQLRALCAVSTDPAAPLVVDLMQGLVQTAQTDAPAITP